jgi:P-type E1-E2 ATPase
MILTFLVVLGFSMIKDGVETHFNNRSFESANLQSANTYDYGNFKFKTSTFAEIQVGDLVLVERDHEIPADILLVSSSSESIYVDTTKIDGESSLKQKFPFI